MQKTLLFTFFLFFIFSCGSYSKNTYSLEKNNKEFVIKGSTNHLMWYKDNTEDITTAIQSITFENAKKYCENLDYAGFKDWRLPTIDELRTIVENYSDIESNGRCQVSEKCNEISCLKKGAKNSSDNICGELLDKEQQCFWNKIWGNKYCGEFWSSTKVKVVDGTKMNWLLDFSYPAIFYKMTSGSERAYVRCVRKY
jgi:hypothetical protein